MTHFFSVFDIIKTFYFSPFQNALKEKCFERSLHLLMVVNFKTVRRKLFPFPSLTQNWKNKINNKVEFQFSEFLPYQNKINYDNDLHLSSYISFFKRTVVWLKNWLIKKWNFQTLLPEFHLKSPIHNFSYCYQHEIRTCFTRKLKNMTEKHREKIALDLYRFLFCSFPLICSANPIPRRWRRPYTSIHNISYFLLPRKHLHTYE